MTNDIVARLRWWKGEINELFEAADEIERLRAALAGSEAWIDRWSKHVGRCSGSDKTCTCGRTAVLYEARAALERSND